MKMLYRYSGNPDDNGNLASFADSNNMSDYAESAMCWAVEIGLISGMDAGMLNPQGFATRSQVATIIIRYCASWIK